MWKRLAIGAGVLGLVGIVGAVGLAWVLGAFPTVIVVERGDTLFELARDHGVTVADLQGWNDLDGDLIEVGQVLLVWPLRAGAQGPEAVAPPGPASLTTPPRRAPTPSTRPSLTMPPEKPCLGGPELSGTADAELAASVGLSEDQVRASMGGFVHHTLACLDGTSPAEPLRLQIRVACTGRVAAVEVLDPGDWEDEVRRCVRETLRYTPFPAHDLPDGDVFEYPLRYSE